MRIPPLLTNGAGSSAVTDRAGERPAIGGQPWDRDLSLRLPLAPPALELYGAEVPELRVAASAVEDDFDEREDRQERGTDRPVMPTEQPDLHADRLLPCVPLVCQPTYTHHN